MEAKFEFTLSNGQICRFEARYKAKLTEKITDADGYKIVTGNEVTEDALLTAFVGNKEISECNNPNFWTLTDTTKGYKKVWGLPVGFNDPKKAQEYEAWIQKVIESGKSPEVKELDKKKRQLEIKKYQTILEAAEKQENIPTNAEKQAYLKIYRNTYNEGGEGWKPEIISKEEYEYAKKRLKKLEELQRKTEKC